MRQAGRAHIAAAIVDMRFADRKMDGLELALNLRDSDSSLPVWLAVSGERQSREPYAVPVKDAVKGLSRGKASTDLHTIFKHVRSNAGK